MLSAFLWVGVPPDNRISCILPPLPLMGQISKSHRAAPGDVYINVVVAMRARVLLVSLGCEVGSYNHGGVLRCVKNVVTNLSVRIRKRQAAGVLLS